MVDISTSCAKGHMELGSDRTAPTLLLIILLMLLQEQKYGVIGGLHCLIISHRAVVSFLGYGIGYCVAVLANMLLKAASLPHH